MAVPERTGKFLTRLKMEFCARPGVCANPSEGPGDDRDWCCMLAWRFDPDAELSGSVVDLFSKGSSRPSTNIGMCLTCGCPPFPCSGATPLGTLIARWERLRFCINFSRRLEGPIDFRLTFLSTKRIYFLLEYLIESFTFSFVTTGLWGGWLRGTCSELAALE